MRFAKGILAGAAVAAVMSLVPSAAFAAGGPPSGRGGGSGGGGGGGQTTAVNNLSVPTIFADGVGFGLPDVAAGTWTSLVPPAGSPSKDWPVDPSAYYYVQGVNAWRAQYEKTVGSTVTATGTWGSNLTGESAALKAGHPVRVEMALTAPGSPQEQGYTVVKLDPAVADRNSSYGTLADSATGPATPASMTPYVWTTGAYLTINGSTTQIPLPGEINATGAPVFGYNWRPATAGDYTLVFHVPATSGVMIGNSNTGSPQTISVTVTVTGGGGGGHHGGGA